MITKLLKDKQELQKKLDKLVNYMTDLNMSDKLNDEYYNKVLKIAGVIKDET